jgi:predicted lipoprotein with Yx(FWY)xxD motif
MLIDGPHEETNMNTNMMRNAVLGASALLALAACGSSAAKVGPAAAPTTTSTAAEPPTTAMHAAAAAPIVMAASTSKFGSLLVDAKGMTLYTLTNAGRPVPCTGQCASFWPPLVLPADTTTALGATGVTGLGTSSSAAGLQVTENGAPLYRFSLDKLAGDTNGDGISSFGGVWHVVAAAGATVATTPVTAASP